MGCDIHIVLEKKHGDRWVGIQKMGYLPEKALTLPGKDLQTRYIRFKLKERDYDFFAELAGVRGPGPDPKGLPDDASDLSRMEFGDDGDLHSHSYTMLRDLLPILAKVKYEKPYCEPTENTTASAVAAALSGSVGAEQILNEWICDYEDVENSLDDYRIVYAFDN